MVNIRTRYTSASVIPVIKGAGVANRHADKRQLAALAATILEGDTGFTPSLRQLAQLFNVSVTYVSLARQFSPATRKAIRAGANVSFTAVLNGPKAPLALPAPRIVTDEELETVVRSPALSAP
jgi:hypothetical protein